HGQVRGLVRSAQGLPGRLHRYGRHCRTDRTGWLFVAGTKAMEATLRRPAGNGLSLRLRVDPGLVDPPRGRDAPLAVPGLDLELDPRAGWDRRGRPGGLAGLH